LSLLIIDTADALVIVTRDQLKRLLREQLTGVSLMEELISERRREAADEKADTTKA